MEPCYSAMSRSERYDVRKKTRTSVAVSNKTVELVERICNQSGGP